VAEQMCAVLSYVLGEGLLHLDVKPSNIMYNDGHATLFDFSVAEEYSEDTPLRDNAGTVEYMAPQQTFRREVGYATDVFGLGVVLYQLLTGGEFPYPVVKRPIPGRGDEPRRLFDYDVRPRPTAEINTAVPPALGDATMKPNDPDMGARYPTPAGFGASLSELRP